MAFHAVLLQYRLHIARKRRGLGVPDSKNKIKIALLISTPKTSVRFCCRKRRGGWGLIASLTAAVWPRRGCCSLPVRRSAQCGRRWRKLFVHPWRWSQHGEIIVATQGARLTGSVFQILSTHPIRRTPPICAPVHRARPRHAGRGGFRRCGVLLFTRFSPSPVRVDDHRARTPRRSRRTHRPARA